MNEVLLFTFLASFVVDYPALKRFIVFSSNHPKEVDVYSHLTECANIGNQNVTMKRKFSICIVKSIVMISETVF